MNNLISPLNFVHLFSRVDFVNKPILSRGGDGGLSVAALSALAWRPRRAPVPPGLPGSAFSSFGLRPRLPLGLSSGVGVFSSAAFPFLAGAFSSGAGVGGCSGSGGSFFSTSARSAARRSAISFSIWSADTFTSPGAPAGASCAGGSPAACSGAFSGAGGSGVGASAGPVSNRLGWGFSSGLTFNFSSAIRYLLF